MPRRRGDIPASYAKQITQMQYLGIVSARDERFSPKEKQTVQHCIQQLTVILAMVNAKDVHAARVPPV